MSKKILWRHSIEPFDRAWFGCCPSGRIPSIDYGIPTCNSNDITSSAVGLSQTAGRWKQMRTHTSKRRKRLFLKSPGAQPLFPYRVKFRRCFDLGFHDPMATLKSTTRHKGLKLLWYTLDNIHHGTCVPIKNYVLNTWYNYITMWVPWNNGPYHWMFSNSWMGSEWVFVDAHFKIFWCSMLDLAWETQCRATVY